MDYYEIVLYVSIKNNSLRIIPFPSIENGEDGLPLAQFSCKRSRETSYPKNGKVKVKLWLAPLRVPGDANPRI